MKSLFVAFLLFSISSLAQASGIESHLFTASIDTTELGLNLGVFRIEIRTDLSDAGTGLAKKHIEFSDPAEGISRYLCISDANLVGGTADVQLIDLKTNSTVYHQVAKILLPIQKSYVVDSMKSKCLLSWGSTFQEEAPVTFDFKPLVIAGQRLSIFWSYPPKVDFSAGRRGATVKMTSGTLSDDILTAQIYVLSETAGGSTFELHEE